MVAPGVGSRLLNAAIDVDHGSPAVELDCVDPVVQVPVRCTRGRQHGSEEGEGHGVESASTGGRSPVNPIGSMPSVESWRPVHQDGCTPTIRIAGSRCVGGTGAERTIPDMVGSNAKLRFIQPLQKWVLNPADRMAFRLRIPPPGDALLETIGRRSGQPRVTPVCDGLQDKTFWLVAQHGRQSDYVRNIEANPRVRVKVSRTGGGQERRTSSMTTTPASACGCSVRGTSLAGSACAPPMR